MDKCSFYNIIDNALEIVGVFQKNGDALYLNNVGMKELGFRSLSFNVRDILPNLLSSDCDFYSFASENKDILHSDAYRKNHSCFPVDVTFDIIKESNNEEVVIVYILDLSEVDIKNKQLKNLEENMHEVIKSKDEFTANLTHELRTPVNGIRGHVRNLYEKEEDISKKRSMDIVLTCCDNMEKIINNLLDFAKIENGKMIIESEKFSLYDLVNSSIATLESVANEKGIELICNISDNVPDEVIGDEFHLSQVINNLLNNAIKFTSQGRVSLDIYKTKHKGRDIELTFFVIDTGIGMSLEDRDKLFKSFSQVDGSITREYGGTGLGLYVCKQLVELMGGHIEVESKKNKGTTFTFNINMQSEKESDGDDITTISQLKESLVLGREEAMKKLSYDDPENISKILDCIEKCKLCVELDNWSKAEGFSSKIKNLVEEGPKEVTSIAFRLVMNVRKEKKEKCRDYLDELEGLITSTDKAGE